MSIPTDLKLYEKVKKRVYGLYKTHSAYRSGFLVKEYKKAFSKKYGDRKQPYKGTKVTRNTGLTRWFAEKWINQRGGIGYKYKNDIYRPSIKITSKTPLTHNELSKREIEIARRKKAKTGRVKRFRPNIKK